MYRRYIFLTILLLTVFRTTYGLDGIALGGGWGEPNDLQGGRIAAIWDWSKKWQSTPSSVLTGFWDISYAYWMTDGQVAGHPHNITIIAVAPNFRLQAKNTEHRRFSPYLQLAVGPAYLSHDTLGRRDFGSRFSFQDIVGFGFYIGRKKHFDLSFNYLHYSNGSLFEPNQGIDVEGFINLTYRF